MFGIIASVLHLGNIKFDMDVGGYASLSSSSSNETHWVSKVRTGRPVVDTFGWKTGKDVCVSPLQLLGIPTKVLHQGLTHRKIEAKSEEVASLLWSKVTSETSAGGGNSSVFVSERCSVPFLWNTQFTPGMPLPKPSMVAPSTGWSTKSTSL